MQELELNFRSLQTSIASWMKTKGTADLHLLVLFALITRYVRFISFGIE
jgi:hypothetical protein